MLVLDKLESRRTRVEPFLNELAALEVVEAQNPRVTRVPVFGSTYSVATVRPSPEPELPELAKLLAREC